MSENPSVGIVGNGVVGNATANAFFGWARGVRCYDVDESKRQHSLVDVLHCDWVMVCLPEGGPLYNFFADHKAWQGTRFVIRSTVPIGTCRWIQQKHGIPQLWHWPEFLSERTALHDAANPRCLMVGSSTGIKCELDDLLTSRFNREAPTHTFEETEAAKLFTNAFFAVKVAAFNELRTLADTYNINWPTVVSLMLADGRINPNHTQVPGPDGKRGFGGKCLLKDLRQVIRQLDGAKLPSMMLQAAETRNNIFDRREPLLSLPQPAC